MDGGWLYLWGTRHYRQTIMSIDGQPMLDSRFEDICRVGRACRGNRSHTRSRYCRAARSPLQIVGGGQRTLWEMRLILPPLRTSANTAFEDAYELAGGLRRPNIEAALNAYENSRIPRTVIIYDRSATHYKAYQPDSETHHWNDETILYLWIPLEVWVLSL